jgi:nucleoid-associated protein YgaU
MGNFEKLSVLVIVVIIVMILVVALYTWTDNPDHGSGGTAVAAAGTETPAMPPTDINRRGPDAGIVTPPPSTPKPPESIPTVTELIARAGLNAKPQPDATPSPAPLPPAPPPPAEPRTHVVQAGDTLGHIAKQYYPQSASKGLAAIRAANPSVQDTSLRVNTKLIIPDLSADPASQGVAPTSRTGAAPAPKPAVATIQKGGTYVVRKGDNLLRISRLAYGREDRWQDIWLANFDAIDDVDHPAAGTRLKIPR